MKLSKLILILVFLILFCNFVYADLVFNEVECSKDGSLELSVYSEDNKVDVNDVKIIARHKTWYDLTLSKFEVNGVWSNDYISNVCADFKGDEAQIRDIGTYDIILEYVEEGTNKELIYEKNCPGLIFSCKLVNVDIKNCTFVDEKYFNLLVELSGINQSISRKLDIFEDISYGIVAENSYEDIKGLLSNKGSLPKDMKIDKIDDNLYLFSKEFIDNRILSVNIYLKSLQSRCKNSNIYDYTECTEIHTDELEQEEPKEKEKEGKIEVPKITGDVIKIEKFGGFNKNYLVYIGLGVIVLLTVIFIIKKQKVNKWV